MNSSTTLNQPEAEITQMIQQAAGNPEMSEKLWATCYEELRRLARKVMLENQNSLSPTGLVHEVFFSTVGPNKHSSARMSRTWMLG